MAERVAPPLTDDDPLVRAAAVGTQRVAGSQDRVLRLLQVLADPVRSVRIAVAKALLDAPIARLPGPVQADLDAAIAEWRAALSSRLGFPVTHLQLAGIVLTLRAFPQAEAAFREVFLLDHQRAEVWVMLLRLAAATRGASTARAVLDEALAALPEAPALLSIGRELEQN